MPFSLRHAAVALVALVLPALAPVRAQAQPTTPPPQSGRVLDEIVAVVGSKAVFRSEVDAFTLRTSQERQLQPTDALWWQMLNDLVDQNVLAVTAQRDTTIEVSDAEVEAGVENRIEQIAQQVGGRSRLQAVFGRSETQLRSELRAQIREQIFADRLKRRFVSTVRISPTEVRTWLARIPADSLPVIPTTVRVAHIVRRIEPSEAARQQALQAITAIRDSILSGRSTFESLAERFSDDPGSGRQGGALGEQNLGIYVPEFRAVASVAPVGQVSEPFRTQFGYHILRVNRRSGERADVSHILLRVSAGGVNPAPLIDYLNTVRDSVLAGAPFERLARTHSQDSTSSVIGGRVVDPQSGQRDLVLAALGPQWTAVVDTMREGQTSRPARVDLLDGSPAYHIVQLQKRSPEHRVSVEEDYAEIMQQALREKQYRDIAAYVQRLRGEVYVEYRGKGRTLAQRFASPTARR